MEKVPNMISTKDLAYISDIFNWNIIALEKIDLYQDICEDETICKELTKAKNIHQKNCEMLLSLLNEGSDSNE